MIPKPGEVIAGRYRLEEVLGQGGFGMVFKATHLEMHRLVALKTLLPQVAMEAGQIERFRQEAVLASSLTHPNTITLFDYGQTEDGLLFLVMEFLRGETLKERLKRVLQFDVAQANHILIQILKSLSEAHNLGIVHRDLKPENIFLCEMPGEQDFVKVLDFGVAKMLAKDNPKPNADLSQGASFGTPKYMAPEQITGQPVGAYTDLYALGLLAYEMVLGRSAFFGRTPLEIITKQVHQNPEPLPASIKATTIGRLIEIVVQKAPERRFQHASAALEMLLEPRDVQSGGWGHVDPSNSLLHAQSTPVPAYSAEVQSALMSEARFDGGDEFDAGATRVQEPFWLSGEHSAIEVERTTIHPGRVHNPARAPVGDHERTRLRSAPQRLQPQALHQAPGPTEVLHVVNEADILSEPASGYGAHLHVETPMPAHFDDPLDNEPTRMVARPQRRPMPGHQAGFAQSNKIHDSEETNPELLKKARRGDREADPVPMDLDRSVLLSVGEVAGLVSTPQVSAHPTTNRHSSVVSEPMVAQASSPHTPTVFPTTGAGADGAKSKLDRRLILSLAVLGLGVCAMMLVAILFLLWPEGSPEIEVAARSNAVAAVDPTTPDGSPASDDESVKTKADEDEDEASEKGKEPETDNVAVNGTEKVEVPTKEEPEPEAILTIKVKPKGASVYVDGRFAGTAPLELPQKEPSGLVTLEIKHEGYDELRKVVHYEFSKTVDLALKKSKAPAKVAQKSATPPATKTTPKKTTAQKAAPKKATPKKTTPKKTTPKKAKPRGKKKKSGGSNFGKW